ncbi:MAG: signal peptidase I [Candidatus Omnitrophica bacterium]|nr:signal peptidase I [Candidatus Omnitrophota bacterium]
MASPRTKALWREYAESILVAVILALAIRTFVVQAFKIPTGSMRPTLMEGDRLLVNKLLYGARVPFSTWRLPALHAPRRGDIIVFRSTEEDHRDFIKRLVAFEGELVEIKESRLWVNGRPITEPAVFRERSYYNRGDYGKPGLAVRVPAGHYFVLGDNSASSRDSRYWGFLPMGHMVGKAMVIYWPLKRVRVLR